MESSPIGGFWNGISSNINKNKIDEGTVITGVLQEDISSKKSKAGDIFSIMLPENYIVDDKILIPQYSKFVGSVVSASPAHKARAGNAGTLQVSVQTLVSPDGISIPVNAFIEENPNQAAKTDLKKSRGIPVGEWGKSAAYSIMSYGGSFGSRSGIPFLYNGQTKGNKDFAMSQGELLPLKLTQPLDVTPLLSAKKQIDTNNTATSSPASINQNNTLTSPANAPTGASNNMMPDTTNPAGPEPF